MTPDRGGTRVRRRAARALDAARRPWRPGPLPEPLRAVRAAADLRRPAGRAHRGQRGVLPPGRPAGGAAGRPAGARAQPPLRQRGGGPAPGPAAARRGGRLPDRAHPGPGRRSAGARAGGRRAAARRPGTADRVGRLRPGPDQPARRRAAPPAAGGLLPRARPARQRPRGGGRRGGPGALRLPRADQHARLHHRGRPLLPGQPVRARGRRRRHRRDVRPRRGRRGRRDDHGAAAGRRRDLALDGGDGEQPARHRGRRCGVQPARHQRPGPRRGRAARLGVPLPGHRRQRRRGPVGDRPRRPEHLRQQPAGRDPRARRGRDPGPAAGRRARLPARSASGADRRPRRREPRAGTR